jgi:hypothetical protein
VQQFLSSPNQRTLWISLFPSLKTGLKGTRFTIVEDIKSNVMAELQTIPKEVFRRCFE